MISMLRELLTFLGAHFYLVLIGCGELVLAVILLTEIGERFGEVFMAKRRPAAGARDRPRLRAGAADAAGVGGAGEGGRL